MRVIVGSRELWPTPNLASAVLTIMASTPDVYGVRTRKGGELASPTEQLAMKIGVRVGTIMQPWAPTGPGRASTYMRDIYMVQGADEVFAFFAPGKFMEGGTGHVVYCALRRGVTVHAYELDADGAIIEIASDEGDLMEAYDGWTDRWARSPESGDYSS